MDKEKQITVTADDLARAISKVIAEEMYQELVHKHPEFLLLLITFGADVAKKLFVEKVEKKEE